MGTLDVKEIERLTVEFARTLEGAPSEERLARLLFAAGGGSLVGLRIVIRGK